MIGLSNMEDLLSVEKFIYGETLSNELTTFGESLKETEYNKIYKYKGRYFKAYRYLKRESGIYVPDPNFFMELELGELSSVYNKWGGRIGDNDQEIYIVGDRSALSPDSNHSQFLRKVPKESNVTHVDKDIYEDGSKSEIYKNKPNIKKIYNGAYTIDYSTGNLKDSNSENIDLEKYVVIGDAENESTNTSGYTIKWLDKTIEVTKTVKEPILEEQSSGSGWAWLLIPFAAITTIASFGALAPVWASNIGSLLKVDGKTYKVTGYRDKEVTTKEVIKQRYVVDIEGNIVRELKDGETLDNVKVTKLVKYTAPMVPGGE